MFDLFRDGICCCLLLLFEIPCEQHECFSRAVMEFLNGDSPGLRGEVEGRERERDKDVYINCIKGESKARSLVTLPLFHGLEISC